MTAAVVLLLFVTKHVLIRVMPCIKGSSISGMWMP
jgi:hypothetical protein